MVAPFESEDTVCNAATVEHCANAAFLCGYDRWQENEMRTMATALAYSSTEGTSFHVLILDSGANYLNIMSMRQYHAYCKAFNVVTNIEAITRTVKGLGNVRNDMVGRATISVPFLELQIVLDLMFYIYAGPGPSILCLATMNEYELSLDNWKDKLWFGGRAQHLHVRNGLLVHNRQPGELATALFTDGELYKLHPSFGHPSVQKLVEVLKRARPEELTAEARAALEDITEACRVCLKESNPRRRFKLTMRTDELRFNSIVTVDVTTLDGRPVLHIVEEATHLTAAGFLNDTSSEEVWRVFVRLWIRTYLGPPDHLRVDQGSNLVSARFRGSATAEGIFVLQVPVECPTKMTHVELFHGPIRAAYNRIVTDLNCSQEEEMEIAAKWSPKPSRRFSTHFSVVWCSTSPCS